MTSLSLLAGTTVVISIFDILTCVPQKCIMDHPKNIVSNQLEESIMQERDKVMRECAIIFYNCLRCWNSSFSGGDVGNDDDSYFSVSGCMTGMIHNYWRSWVMAELVGGMELDVFWHCNKYHSFIWASPGTQYSKTCLKRTLKKCKTKILKTDGSLMQVKSIAECSLGAFCNTFELH